MLSFNTLLEYTCKKALDCPHIYPCTVLYVTYTTLLAQGPSTLAEAKIGISRVIFIPFGAMTRGTCPQGESVPANHGFDRVHEFTGQVRRSQWSSDVRALDV